MPWDTILVLKIWIKKILSINFHGKCHSNEYTYRHHYTKFYKLLPSDFIRYLRLCFLWMAPRKNEIVEGSYYTLSLCCFFICEKKKVTNNKKFWILIFVIVDVQITAIVFLLFSGRLGRGRGCLRLTLLDYFITKNQRATQL